MKLMWELEARIKELEEQIRNETASHGQAYHELEKAYKQQNERLTALKKIAGEMHAWLNKLIMRHGVKPEEIKQLKEGCTYKYRDFLDSENAPKKEKPGA